jgi:hypothetical protein
MVVKELRRREISVDLNMLMPNIGTRIALFANAKPIPKGYCTTAIGIIRSRQAAETRLQTTLYFFL